MGLFDVHAHLTDPRLARRVDEVLDRARAAGLTSILSNGLNPADNEAVRALARREPMVRPCFGLYPVDAVLVEMQRLGVPYPRETPPVSPDEAVAWVREHADEAFAIGEIGLDGHWVPKALWDAQEKVFRELVRIALEADKAIIVHTRRRETRTLEILDEMGATRVNWHCFGGKLGLAQRIAERGHCLSIPAHARRHAGFTRLLTTLPRDRILFETDCPYLGPNPGEDNEPANVRGTLEYAAELWKEPVDAVLSRTSETFERLFRAPP